MNLKTLSLLGSVALAALAVPAAEGAGRQMGGGARISAPQATAQIAPSTVARQQYTGTSTRTYNHRTGYDGSRYPRYRPRYGGFYYGGYPYSNYPFGYGYGYPYFGASAELYYFGTHPYGRAEYSYRGSEENVAVAVQRRLAEAGYYRGAIDGVIGNGTRNAIRAYERANRLPADGRIDADLLARLRIS
ncbi:MAG: peptidoglycan-binding protein [Chthoniobacterales bacterium]